MERLWRFEGLAKPPLMNEACSRPERCAVHDWGDQRMQVKWWWKAKTEGAKVRAQGLVRESETLGMER